MKKNNNHEAYIIYFYSIGDLNYTIGVENFDLNRNYLTRLLIN